jgi:curved DNA-binding protein CbpA
VGGTTGNAWWDILDCRPHAGYDEILRAYREKVKQVHPDVPGGTDEQFHRVQAAFQQARETVKP